MCSNKPHDKLFEQLTHTLQTLQCSACFVTMSLSSSVHGNNASNLMLFVILIS